jgi:tetratricopeptide (TPR) repeat protein
MQRVFSSRIIGSPSTHAHLMKPNHALRALVLATGLSLSAVAVQAQMFKDLALEALHKAGKPTELQRLATQRVAAQADDAQAVLALAVTALAGSDAGARQSALARAEACVQRLPQAAACHYALGTVMGVQAMSEGMLKAARSIGTIKTALQQAQSLEPNWYPARSALVEFYLTVPGMMGGSTAKAAELALGAPVPDQARALQARVALQDGKAETALTSLTSLLSVADNELADDARQWGAQAAFNLVNNGQAPKAAGYFERLSKERPGHAMGPYGLARVRTESGALDEAVKLFELSATLKGAEILPIDYRKGIALQQAGRNDAARAAFKSFVAVGKGQKASLDDARKRIEQLGG